MLRPYPAQGQACKKKKCLRFEKQFDSSFLSQTVKIQSSNQAPGYLAKEKFHPPAKI